MILFEYINHNLTQIKKLVTIGLIPCVILKHYSIYARYDYYKKLGHNQRNAIIYTGLDNNISETWVYKIIKYMEKEV